VQIYYVGDWIRNFSYIELMVRMLSWKDIINNLWFNGIKTNKTIAFIDLETTGLNIVTDRIVEICILKVMVDNSTVIKTLRIKPNYSYSYFATMIHGIKDEDVKDCPTFASVARNISSLIIDCDLAGFNSIN